MRKIYSIALAVSAAWSCAGYAQDSRRPPMVFISPAGEPFRSEQGDYPSRQWFEGADRDGDTRLTLTEMEEDAARFFLTLDRDNDGRLSGLEISRYESEIAPEASFDPASSMAGGRPPAGMRPPTGGAPPGTGGRMRPPRDMANMPRGAGMFALVNVTHMLLGADDNQNWVVTQEEMRRWMASQFEALDSRQQGWLAFADLPETPVQRLRGRGRQR
jgi:hypothetical protein